MQYAAGKGAGGGEAAAGRPQFAAERYFNRAAPKDIPVAEVPLDEVLPCFDWKMFIPSGT